MDRCLSLCKDTNFKANHNLCEGEYDYGLGCLSLCKDTNFKANHNASNRGHVSTSDVCLYAKIRILKQITTE